MDKTNLNGANKIIKELKTLAEKALMGNYIPDEINTGKMLGLDKKSEITSWPICDDVAYYGHPSTIAKLKEEGKIDEYEFNLIPCKLIESTTLVKPRPIHKKQDRRKNKRIQARKRLREERTPKIPDETIYLINNTMLKKQNELIFGYNSISS